MIIKKSIHFKCSSGGNMAQNKCNIVSAEERLCHLPSSLPVDQANATPSLLSNCSASRCQDSVVSTTKEQNFILLSEAPVTKLTPFLIVPQSEGITCLLSCSFDCYSLQWIDDTHIQCSMQVPHLVFIIHLQAFH